MLQPRKVCPRRHVAASVYLLRYLVRHGESQWNKAQSKMDLHGMVRTTDHCLSAKGREQAEQLSQKLLELEKQRRPSAMLRPDVVMASPLGRALQTAVIGYGALAAKVGRSEMVLAPNCKAPSSLFDRTLRRRSRIWVAWTRTAPRWARLGDVGPKDRVEEILDSCSEELQGLYSNKKDRDSTSSHELQEAIASTFQQLQFDLLEASSLAFRSLS